MCAGSLETPKLLMLSGIGPAARLNAVGITPVLDVPEIGQNLQDHPNVTLFYKSQAEVDAYYPQLYSFCRANPETDLPTGQSDTCLVYWPAPSAMKQAAKRMLPGKVLPASLFDTRAKAWLRSAVETALSTRAAENFIAHTYGIVVILGKPKSRGELWLASSDPRAQAVIDPAYFTHPEDMQTMLAGVKLAQQIAKAPALSAFGNSPLMPGKRATSDAALAEVRGEERDDHVPLRGHLPHGRGRARASGPAPAAAWRAWPAHRGRVGDPVHAGFGDERAQHAGRLPRGS
jgi:choline dehydrogenase